MTDNEIIKALECCQSPAPMCKYCSMPKDMQDDCRCMETLSRNALDLINRQKAEIERLIGDVTTYKLRWAKATTRLDTAKTEAVKEFADTILNYLYERIEECDKMTAEDPIWINRLKWARESIVIFINEYLSKFKKEMVGEDNA